MTNHSETTGSSENGDITGRDQSGREHPAWGSHTTYDGDVGYGTGPADHQVTLRTPAELADALPYLLGYRPEDSIVLVALHDRGGRGRFGGRARLGIPANPDDWEAVAQQLAQGLVKGSERRGTRPASMVAYLCQEPGKGETGRQVMERLEPLAHRLRLECGRLDVPVIEALCIADGRFWSYCCAGKGCCPVEGAAMGLPGTSVLAAAATYAGIQVRGTLRELRARLLPLETGAALQQEVALDAAGMALLPRILDEASRAAVAEETLGLAGRVMRRLAEAPVVVGALPADSRDDDLLGCDEAAALILGLQDRVTRDRAAGWMEGEDAAPALRLWRALARRCVGPYGEHAAAPLTLAGWVAWSMGDELEAREALAMALGADPEYLFARLLHQACNEGLDPESVRRCLRAEREGRGRPTAPERPDTTATAVEDFEGSRDSESPRDPGGAEFRAGPCGPEAKHEGRPVCAEHANGPGDAEHEDRPGDAEHEDRPGEDEGSPSRALPHSAGGCASETGQPTAPTGLRRRRRVRSAGVGGSRARAAAGAEESQEPEARARGASELLAHPTRPHVTRPATPGRGGARTRPARKASPGRRDDCREGLRSDSDDITEKG
ncbi:hypothetical protein J2X68_005993 [Streptomyces sp. 3330]|uniref:DUF4192 domain-containing protein n=1 Tax=Streptomyces sp. 3330 TaxID=2817755 RepID=UPI0028572AC5|nr:DUF4192 domain-containing protein [Streptomyces sp. 3330]MDR6979259.1 hypothetical protein [Streptomyces sp. 3330]